LPAFGIVDEAKELQPVGVGIVACWQTPILGLGSDEQPIAAGDYMFHSSATRPTRGSAAATTQPPRSNANQIRMCVAGQWLGFCPT